MEHWEVQGKGHNLLNSYLINRFQFAVNINEFVSSSLLLITIGVAQECVFGLFLFLMYINDVSNSCSVDMNLYADDLVIICNDTNIQNRKISSCKVY